MMVESNVYYGVALPFEKEENKLVDSSFDSKVKLIDEGDKVYLFIRNIDLKQLKTKLINTEILGQTKFTRQHFENPDSTPILFNYDYFRNVRGQQPTAGPIESLKEGEMKIQVW